MGSRQTHTVESGYLRESLHKPRQQGLALGPCVNYVLGFLVLCERGQPVNKPLTIPDLMYCKKKMKRGKCDKMFSIVLDVEG